MVEEVLGKVEVEPTVGFVELSLVV